VSGVDEPSHFHDTQDFRASPKHTQSAPITHFAGSWREHERSRGNMGEHEGEGTRALRLLSCELLWVRFRSPRPASQLSNVCAFI
jgi:hypothetical protein